MWPTQPFGFASNTHPLTTEQINSMDPITTIAAAADAAPGIADRPRSSRCRLETADADAGSDGRSVARRWTNYKAFQSRRESQSAQR